MRTFSILASSLLIGLALMVAGCGTTSQTSHASPTSQTTVTMGADWVRIYTDLKTLKHDADVVVLGKVVGIAQQTSSGGIPFTDFSYQVLKVHKTSPGHTTVGATIIIHQTGGVVNGQLWQTGDDPLMKVVEQSILFLHEFSPGYYFVIGGPSGRFLIHGNMVAPLNNEGVQMAPTALATFESDIDNA